MPISICLKNIRIAFCMTALVAAVLLLPGCAILGGSGESNMSGAHLDTASGSSGQHAGGAIVVGKEGPPVSINGLEYPTIKADGVSQGFLVSDSQGNLAWIPGPERKKPNQNYLNARELKLKVRELADQMFVGLNDKSVCQSEILPASFVNMNNLDETSSFGRFLAEQLYYELNQRGLKVRDYRNQGANIRLREGDGEFYLSRERDDLELGANTLVLTGTYFMDGQGIFVNARLMRPTDGKVLRTGQLILPATTNNLRLMAGSSGGGAGLESCAVQIVGVQGTTRNQSKLPVTPFELGEDIH